MKGRIIVFTSMLLVLVCLSGCSSSSPDEVVHSYMEAMAAFDSKGMAAQACPEMASKIMATSEQVATAKDSGMEFGFAGLSYETVSENETEAIVRLTGVALWAGNKEEIDEDLHLVLVDGQWKLCENFQ